MSQKSLWKRLIWGILITMVVLCLSIAGLLVLMIVNSYHRDTLQKVISPDKSKVIVVEWDTEDDPYYSFELETKTFLGSSKYLGACYYDFDGKGRVGRQYKVLHWLDNRRFLLQISNHNKLIQKVVIDTEHPYFPCVHPIFPLEPTPPFNFEKP